MLERKSSLVFENANDSPRLKALHATLKRALDRNVVVDTDEVIPDSEDEYVIPFEDSQEQTLHIAGTGEPLDGLVSMSQEEMREVEGLIYLSSDSESDVAPPSKGKSVADPFTETPKKRTSQSADVIELTDSSDPESRTLPLPKVKSIKRRTLVVSDSDSDNEDYRGPGRSTDDGAILSFDDGKGARRPIAKKKSTATPSHPSSTRGKDIHGPRKDLFVTADGTPVVQTPTIPRPSTSTSAHPLDGSPAPAKGKGGNRKKVVIPESPSIASSSVPGTPASLATTKIKMGKKASEEAAQKERSEYAQALFNLLNNEAFDNKLPFDTELYWNARLQTTAGKAHWKRTKEGGEVSTIELSPKILDSDERIRNTLSHEMCHLASWVIDRNIKENHGPLWKNWAAKVMTLHPDIEITTKHSYEITYKYYWKCGNLPCGKMYGRFSKSINPETCLCGACKVGELIPQFTQGPKRTPKAKADGHQICDKPRDSPRTVERRPPLHDISSPVPLVLDNNDNKEIDGGVKAGVDEALLEVTNTVKTSGGDEKVTNIIKQLSFIDLTGDD